MSYVKEGYLIERDFSRKGTTDGVEWEKTYHYKEYKPQRTDQLGLVIIRCKHPSYDTTDYKYIDYVLCLETAKQMQFPQDKSMKLTRYITGNGSKYYENSLIAIRSSDWEPLPSPPPDDTEWNTGSSLYRDFITETKTIEEKKGLLLEKTNIPMYDFFEFGEYPPSDAFNGINKYISSGDYSDASNYDDIVEWQLKFEIYLDGAYPNLYVKCKNPDKMPNNFLKSYNLEIIPPLQIGSSDKFYQTLIDINSTNYISYSEYTYDIPIPIDLTYKLNIILTNASDPNNTITSESLFEVKRDGTIGETTSGITNHLIIDYFPNQTPSDNSYPDKDDSKWNIEPSTNEFSGANTLTKTYEIDSTGVVALGKFLWSSTFKDNIFGLVQSPIENVVSLKAMPISGEGVDVEKIKIGNVESTIDGKVVRYADGIKKSVGKIKIPRIFNNFVDFSAINIMVYLPFIGFKELDPVLYVNRTLWLEYVYDTIYGNVLAILSVADVNGDKLVHDVFQANCGIDIAITSTNRGQIEAGFVRGAIGAATSFVTGNIGGVLDSGYNAMSQEFHSTSNGVGNASLMNKMDMTARVIIKRPQMFEPNNYGHTFGYPCHQYKKISEFTDENFNTYIKCENFICSELEDALDVEKDELKTLMENGVFV